MAVLSLGSASFELTRNRRPARSGSSRLSPSAIRYGRRSRRSRLQPPASTWAGEPSAWAGEPSAWAGGSSASAVRTLLDHGQGPRARLGWRKGFGEELGDVDRTDGSVGPGLRRLEAVLEHGHAERALRRDGRGTGGESLCRPRLVDPRAACLLHPHAPSAGAATEGVAAAVLHLPQLEAGDRAQDLARLVDDPVVAGQVARIVQRDGAPFNARSRATARGAAGAIGVDHP